MVVSCFAQCNTHTLWPADSIDCTTSLPSPSWLVPLSASPPTPVCWSHTAPVLRSPQPFVRVSHPCLTSLSPFFKVLFKISLFPPLFHKHFLDSFCLPIYVQGKPLPTTPLRLPERTAWL